MPSYFYTIYFLLQIPLIMSQTFEFFTQNEESTANMTNLLPRLNQLNKVHNLTDINSIFVLFQDDDQNTISSALLKLDNLLIHKQCSIININKSEFANELILHECIFKLDKAEHIAIFFDLILELWNEKQSQNQLKLTNRWIEKNTRMYSYTETNSNKVRLVIGTTSHIHFQQIFDSFSFFFQKGLDLNSSLIEDLEVSNNSHLINIIT